MVSLISRGRDGMNPMPPILGHLQRRTYEGNRWTKQNKIKVNHGKDALHMIWDFSIAMDDQYRLEGVWDSQYVKRLGFANQVSHTRHEAVPTRDRTRFTVQGHDAPERIPAGWPRQRKPESRVMEYEGKTLTMLYGDTHTHSWTSDGADPADYYYHFARDFAGLDYFALSDHDFTVSYTPGLEALISFLPEQFTEKDFICFQAFEFSSQHKGHRVVVFERGYKPTFSMVVPPKNISNKTGQLYRFLHRFGGDSNSRVLVTSHNMFSIGNDFAEYDEGLEPLYDVTSLHMVAEKSFEEIATVQQATGNLLGFQLFKLIGNINKLNPSKSIAEKWFMSWRQALADGLPLGAYGGSDTHAANAVGYVASGLWVEGKSPKAIFDAMFARRSLGLDSQLRSGDMWNTSPLVRNRVRTPDMLRADVRFFLSGHFMGSRVKLDSAPVVRVVAANLDPHDPVRAVVFIRDGVEVHTEFGAEGGRSEFEWTDTGFSPGRHYYYVRVEFQSGNTAFPSPVFVNY